MAKDFDSEDNKNYSFFFCVDEDLRLRLGLTGQQKDVSRIIEKFKRKFESFGEFLKNLNDKSSGSRKKSSNFDSVKRQSYRRDLNECEFSSYLKNFRSFNSKNKNDFENNQSFFTAQTKNSLICLLNRISTYKSVVYSHGQTSKESLVKLNEGLLNLKFKKVYLSDKEQELKQAEEKGKSETNKDPNSYVCWVSLVLQIESPNDEHGIKSYIDGNAFIATFQENFDWAFKDKELKQVRISLSNKIYFGIGTNETNTAEILEEILVFFKTMKRIFLSDIDERKFSLLKTMHKERLIDSQDKMNFKAINNWYEILEEKFLWNRVRICLECMSSYDYKTYRESIERILDLILSGKYELEIIRW